VPALLGRERDAGKQPPRLRGIVVLHGGLEVLASGQGLLKLAPEPAQEADLRRARHSGSSRTESESPSSSTLPPSA